MKQKIKTGADRENEIRIKCHLMQTWTYSQFCSVVLWSWKRILKSPGWFVVSVVLQETPRVTCMKVIERLGDLGVKGGF